MAKKMPRSRGDHPRLPSGSVPPEHFKSRAEFFPQLGPGPNRRAGELTTAEKPASPSIHYTDELKRRFLALCLENGPHLVRHAYAVGISPATERNHRKNDPEYAAAFEDMQEMWREKVEKEVFRRAIEGVDEPIFYQGQRVDTVKRYSDQLLAMVVKKYDPLYTERNQVDVNVSGGVLVVGASPDDLQTWRQRYAPTAQQEKLDEEERYRVQERGEDPEDPDVQSRNEAGGPADPAPPS